VSPEDLQVANFDHSGKHRLSRSVDITGAAVERTISK
jgi:hypothetical protein